MATARKRKCARSFAMPCGRRAKLRPPSALVSHPASWVWASRRTFLSSAAKRPNPPISSRDRSGYQRGFGSDAERAGCRRRCLARQFAAGIHLDDVGHRLRGSSGPGDPRRGAASACSSKRPSQGLSKRTSKAGFCPSIKRRPKPRAASPRSAAAPAVQSRFAILRSPASSARARRPLRLATPATSRAVEWRSSIPGLSKRPPYPADFRINPVTSLRSLSWSALRMYIMCPAW